MNRTFPLRVHRRVRELYLEFMLLATEMDGIRSKGGPVDLGKHAHPYLYLRLECEPADGAHAHGEATLTEASRQLVNAVDGVMLTHSHADTKGDGGDADGTTPPRHEYGCTYRVKVDSAGEKHAADPFFPPHWRNNACGAGACVAFSAYYRGEVQRAFYQCALLAPEGPEWKRSLARGRVQLRKLQELLHMKKYRAMRKRYDWAAQLSADDLLATFASEHNGGGDPDGAAPMERLRQAQMGLGNRDVYGYKPE